MADPKALSILRSGVRNWNEWRRVEIHGDEPSGTLRYPTTTLSSKPDVGVIDLRGAELPDIELRGAQLEHCSLEGANLAGADLRQANLSWTILAETNLKGANLKRASLNGTYASFAKFDGARLGGATLSNATLHIANFAGCELVGASFADSDLRDANLNSANLSGSSLHLTRFIRTHLNDTVLTEAKMGGTILSDVDLSTASGMESIFHSGPSTIGLDTLLLSRGMIPEVFLRGTGVEEALIEYLPSLIRASAIDFYSCFISYSHEQKSFARRLHEQLQMRGIRCWLDDHQILPGDNIYEAIDKGIRLWDKVLLCCSEASLSSWWVGDEIDKALEKEREILRERGSSVLAIIPLTLDDFFLKHWQDGRAATLRKRRAADFIGWESDNAKFEASLEKLVKALRPGKSSRQTPPVSRL